MPLASLVWDARPATAGVVVLVLHGGAIEGLQTNRPWSHNVIRLWPFGKALARVPGPIAVARLRFRHLGWNGDEALPLVDARWALEQLRAAYPGRPIALVGHSMGGRVALHLGDEPDVRLVVGLSSWMEWGDPRPGAKCRTVLVHGDRDAICPLWAARLTVDEMVAQGRPAALVRVARSGHGMMVRAPLWHRLVTAIVATTFAAELGQTGAPRREGRPDDVDAVDVVDAVVATALRRGGIVDI